MGTYVCDCADVFPVSPCPEPIRDCVTTTVDGVTLWNLRERAFPGMEPRTITSAVDKQEACVGVERITSGRTLRASRRRQTPRHSKRHCEDLRRFPVCVRDNQRSWLVRVADCEAERLIYLGTCNGEEADSTHMQDLHRFLRARRGKNIKVTAEQPPKPQNTPPTPPPTPRAPDIPLKGMKEQECPETGTTIERL